MNYSTETLPEQEIKHLADIMADNPNFAEKLADAIAERLDEKYGFDQGWMKASIEELKQGQNDLKQNMNRRFDTLEHNFKMFGEKQDLFEREMMRVNGRLDTIDGRLDSKD